ncbi:angiomotin-like protein 2b [Electrophorus electricus]|uniref:angiomotin-like protein 2b n=1 Tax=Electrophorus electricus TaxID=8005 RepID=UPI0015D08A8F|nr:angiomotin-like protein 2b [Electrophorus electricus]
MRSEETSGTVLHRLIQEQLRYGNPTDTRTLLAIQQQALRRGGDSGGGGAGSSQSSSESLSQDDPQYPQLSARQEPQGQEHKADYQHSEGYWLYPHPHHEQLPTYEQARAQSQYLTSQWFQGRHSSKACSLEENLSGPPIHNHLSWDGDIGHSRSLSERLMQLSLQHKTSSAVPVESPPATCSWSYRQMSNCHAIPHMSQTNLESKNEHSRRPQETTLHRAPEYEHFHSTPPPPFHSPHHRLVPLVPSPEAHHVLSTAPPAGMEVLTISYNQMELLMKENERLRQELEGHEEKAIRIQKLEQEIQRISEAYDTLRESCVKREALEQALRNKLMAEVRRLQELNADLRDNGIQAAKDEERADQNQHIMAKLCEQNQEQQLRCEQLEKEAQLLHGEVEVQLRRADALQTALSSAQSGTRQLQAELQRKNAYVERVERLQGVLAQLQATCKKREGLEQRLRTRLEQELRSLRNQQRQAQAYPASGPASSVTALLERLREREERILALEADMMRWEQKYLEESTMREFAMDVAATAAAQRDTNMINHSPGHSSKNSFSDDLPHAELRNQEVENRIHALYGQIQEKDALISYLQQRLQQDQEKSEVVEVVSALSPTPSAGTSPTQDKESIQQQCPEAVGPFKGLDTLEAEAVEIFI